MITLTIWIMLASMLIYFTRVITGPSIWDRLHSFSLISTKVLLIIILYASLFDEAFLLDIAIVCALVGFIGMTFTSLFVLDRIIKGEKR